MILDCTGRRTSLNYVFLLSVKDFYEKHFFKLTLRENPVLSMLNPVTVSILTVKIIIQ